jgi:hypothetical protein
VGTAEKCQAVAELEVQLSGAGSVEVTQGKQSFEKYQREREKIL